MVNHETVSCYRGLFLIHLQFNIFQIIWKKIFYPIIADNSEIDNEKPIYTTLSGLLDKVSAVKHVSWHSTSKRKIHVQRAKNGAITTKCEIVSLGAVILKRLYKSLG